MDKSLWNLHFSYFVYREIICSCCPSYSFGRRSIVYANGFRSVIVDKKNAGRRIIIRILVHLLGQPAAALESGEDNAAVSSGEDAGAVGGVRGENIYRSIIRSIGVDPLGKGGLAG